MMEVATMARPINIVSSSRLIRCTPVKKVRQVCPVPDVWPYPQLSYCIQASTTVDNPGTRFNNKMEG
jgi:hypothetical protein